MAAGCEGNSVPEAAGCDPSLCRRLPDAVGCASVVRRSPELQKWWSCRGGGGSQIAETSTNASGRVVFALPEAAGCEGNSPPEAGGCKQNPCRSLASPLVASTPAPSKRRTRTTSRKDSLDLRSCA